MAMCERGPQQARYGIEADKMLDTRHGDTYMCVVMGMMVGPRSMRVGKWSALSEISGLELKAGQTERGISQSRDKR